MADTLFKEIHCALVWWDDNVWIPDDQPSQYWPKYASRFDADPLAKMTQRRALPAKLWTPNYGQFLVAGRPLIASVIRQGYDKLANTSP